jgi:ribosome-binding protein aMBF1 (putative translation factor)
MSHQDWKPVVWTKQSVQHTHAGHRPSNVSNVSNAQQRFRKLDNSSGEAPVLKKQLNKQFAKQLQMGRLSKKMTQKELANAISEKSATINMYETGVVPTTLVLNKLSKILGIQFKMK